MKTIENLVSRHKDAETGIVGHAVGVWFYNVFSDWVADLSVSLSVTTLHEGDGFSVGVLFRGEKLESVYLTFHTRSILDYDIQRISFPMIHPDVDLSTVQLLDSLYGFIGNRMLELDASNWETELVAYVNNYIEVSLSFND